MKGFRFGRESEVRVRSRKGIVHLRYSAAERTFCGVRLADGKVTTRGAVSCDKCIAIRDSGARFESYSDRDQQRRHDTEYRKRHRITNAHRAAVRERRSADGRIVNRYLAHWVLQPKWTRRPNFFLTEHRLYIERRREPPNYDDGSGVYYCPECEKIGRRTGPDGLPKGDMPGTPLEFLEEFGVTTNPWAGNVEPTKWLGESLGDIAPDDPTIHETGRKMPRGETEDRRRERMLADLRTARKKWDMEHTPSMAGDSPP